MKKIYLLLGLIVFISGCEKDEITPEKPREGSVQVKGQTLQEIEFNDLPGSIAEYFDNEKFMHQKNDMATNNFGRVRTDMPVKKVIDTTGKISYTFVVNNKTTYNKSSSPFYFDNLVIYEHSKRPDEIYVIRYTPTEKWYNTSRDFRNYSGKIAFYTVEGNKINSLKMEDGQMLGTGNKNSSYKATTVCYLEFLRSVSVGSNGGSMEGDENNSGYTWTTTYYYELTCRSIGGSGGDQDYGGGDGDGYEDTNDGHPEPGSFPSTGGGGWTPPTFPEEETVKIKIDPSINEHPCLAKVLTEILTSDSDLFTETIGRFIDNPEYDLTFTVGECANTDNACTDGEYVDDTGEIFVKIEDTNQNPINFAAMILHEGIHAEIFRYVNEHHEGYVDPNDKPQLFEYYQYYKAHEDEPTDIDHIYMTQYYINPIAEALRELDNNQYPLNYYKSFAWDGLREFDPNNSLGVIDEYSQYRNEVSLNFNIQCNE